MFHHMVMFRFKSDTTEDQVAAMTAGLATLPGKIAELAAYRFGPDVGMTEGSWDYGVAADFDSAADYVTYSNHPAHRAVVDQAISPYVDEIVRVQYGS